MNTRRFYMVLVSVMVLIVTACGGGSENGGDDTVATNDDGGDGDTTETTTPASPDTTAPAGNGGTPEVTEMGSFSVNGTEFAVTFLNRCIPFEGENSDVIDLQPIAQGQGALLNLYGTGDSVEVSVQGPTVEEMFGSIAFSSLQADENNLSGDRWTGSATLDDALSAVDPVNVTWDVMVPGEAVDCSL